MGEFRLLPLTMLRALQHYRIYTAFGLAVVALFVFLETSGRASGGDKAPERIDPQQIRSTSPGSWTFLYWAHGMRGK